MKKYAPYILILIIFVGLFSPGAEVRAQAIDPIGNCLYGDAVNGFNSVNVTKSACEKAPYSGTWDPTPTSNPTNTQGAGENPLNPGCAVITGDFDDCLVKITYYLFYALPAFLMALMAQFFNVVISLTLGSVLYTNNSFIPEAWAVVRDFSNIFFILILIYVAIQTILGLGGHEVKKTIAHIVVMALLINFSMFFTKVIIDSSNILALVFYNKINVETKVKTGSNTQDRTYMAITDSTKTGNVEKDIAGGIVSSFDPTKMLTPEFFDKAKSQTQGVMSASLGGAAAFIGGGALVGSFIPIVGTAVGAGIGAIGYGVKSILGSFVATKEVPTPLLLGIILVSGTVMIYAAYAFFIVGLSFISRLIELWILIIVSPFAFMSFSIPGLAGIESIGWNEWIKRLLRVSFMAPIFMFFLYLIFKLINADIFANLSVRTYQEQGTLEAILLLVLPAMMVLIILHKATEKAKKTSGELGSMIIKGASVGLGIAGGLALGGGARVLQASVGKYGEKFAQSETAKKWIKEKKFGADTLQKTASYFGGASFDARKGIIGGALRATEGVSGINLGMKSKIFDSIGIKDGGYREDRKRMVEKRQKRSDELKVSEDEPLKQNLNRAEEDLQEMLNKVIKDFERIDRELVGARQDRTDARRGSLEELAAIAKIKALNDEKANLRTGVTGPKVISGPNIGRTIKQMQNEVIPDKKTDIETENRERKWAYAESLTDEGGRVKKIFRGRWFGMQQAGDNRPSRKEAAYKIRMDAKIETKT